MGQATFANNTTIKFHGTNSGNFTSGNAFTPSVSGADYIEVFFVETGAGQSRPPTGPIPNGTSITLGFSGTWNAVGFKNSP